MSSLTIYAAMSAVMEDVGSVAKTDRNTSQGFQFRGVDAVVNACSPALRKHGVVVLPNVLENTYGTVTTGKNNTAMGHAQVKVEYRFYGPAGDHISAVVMGEAFDSGDKATAKAMSVAFRTALLQSLSLPTDEPDPDALSYERSTEPSTEPIAPPRLVANSKQVAKWTAALSTAPDLVALEAVVEDIKRHELDVTLRDELIACYLGRKAELDA